MKDENGNIIMEDDSAELKTEEPPKETTTNTAPENI